MAIRSNHLFVNLPVKDLEKSKQFFEDIGFEFNEQLTDKNAACVIVGPDMFVMLLMEDYFQRFTQKEVTDTSSANEVIVSISSDSKAGVDEIVGNALSAGAVPSNDRMDNEFMYASSFRDLDGHLWEVMYMPENEDDSDEEFYA
ncbi:MAG TPA: VOC family protein [Planococcus sp. (in: firmicutes)]|nr:VOC family protein [Planococcus sp. (in: firmicutes)]